MKESRATLLQQIRQEKNLGIRLLVGGILIVAVGIPFFIKARQFNAAALRAPGKILELERQQTGKDVSYFPVFSFVDQAGAAQVIHSRIGSSHASYEAGDAVEVLYAADDPDHAKLNTFFSVWTWPMVFGGGGFVLIIAGILLLQGAASWLANELADARKER